jgi:hypothetical protein
LKPYNSVKLTSVARCTHCYRIPSFLPFRLFPGFSPPVSLGLSSHFPYVCVFHFLYIFIIACAEQNIFCGILFLPVFVFCFYCRIYS